jgi:indole-3-glycerol phosphate synthase
LVSESGLSDPAELGQLEDLGVKGFLIGEAFMAARDPGSALARMFER